MNIIYPDILSNRKEVSAFFTESNRTQINSEGEVPGLNLGYNTPAPGRQVDDNFHKLFSFVNWDAGRYAIARQVHGNHIETVEKPGIFDDTDGLVTKTPDLAIGIRVADCAAVLAADPQNRVIGAFHAGWKGAASGIVLRGLQRMISLGAVPEGILVYTSPCISQKNFEVGEEVAVQFPDEFVDRKTYVKPHVDLAGFVRHQLLEAGVREQNIQMSGECTIENDKFYSYRRERGKAGRMLAMIKINHTS